MRYHYLDNLRAILMMLGVVLHTCAAFSIHKYWVVSYPESIAWTDAVNNAIFFFRMPMFFLISGFFAILLLQKWTVTKFLSNKLLRIGLPLVVALLAFNLPQQFLLSSQSTTSTYQISFKSGHLWFLINLLVYFFVIVLFYPMMKFVSEKLNDKHSVVYSFLILLLAPFINVALKALYQLGIPIYDDILLVGSIDRLFDQFDYFVIGACLYFILRTRITALVKSKIWTLAAVFLFFGSYLTTVLINFDGQGMVDTVMTIVFTRWQVIGICMFLLCAGFYLLDNTNPFIQGLFNASYSVYLIHHLIIVLLVLIASNYLPGLINPNLVFIFILVSALTFSYSFHHFIVAKSKVFSLLFNGKTKQ